MIWMGYEAEGWLYIAVNIGTCLIYCFGLAPLMKRLITVLAHLGRVWVPRKVARSVDRFIFACGIGHGFMAVWMAFYPHDIWMFRTQLVLDAITHVATGYACFLIARLLPVLLQELRKRDETPWHSQQT